MNYPQPEFPLRFLEIDGQLKVYDVIRKDFFVLTPEEWVRQHVVHLLMQDKKVAKGRIAIERLVKGSTKRFDVLIHNTTTGKPEMIIECKSFKTKLNQSTLNQVGRYNMNLQVPYLVITNWNQWLAAEIDTTTKEFNLLTQFPDL